MVFGKRDAGNACVSLAPGFSQVIERRNMNWKPFKRFRMVNEVSVPWLKPGANEIY